MKKSIHLVLQGKGGVGKSLISAMLAQYFNSKEVDLLAIDTDPVNATFAGFKALNVHNIQFMKGTKVDASMFDKLTKTVLDHDGVVVNDNGATSFLPLCDYLVTDDILEIFQEEGFKVVIHTVITGGQALKDTFQGLDTIATQFSDDIPLVVWKNEYFGEIHYKTKSFEELPIYKKHQGRIDGILHIPEQAELAKLAVKTMLESRMTFDEVAACEDVALFDFLQKRRVEKFKKLLFGQLETLYVGGVL